jgi:hypothetical protein
MFLRQELVMLCARLWSINMQRLFEMFYQFITYLARWLVAMCGRGQCLIWMYYAGLLLRLRQNFLASGWSSAHTQLILLLVRAYRACTMLTADIACFLRVKSLEGYIWWEGIEKVISCIFLQGLYDVRLHV